MSSSTSDESTDAPQPVMEKSLEKLTPIRMRIPVCRPEELFHLGLPEQFLPLTTRYELHYGVAFSFSHFVAFARDINPNLPDSNMEALVFGMRYLRRVTRILNLYVALVKNPGRSALPDELIDAKTGGVWILSICSFDHPWAEGRPSRKAVEALSRILGEEYHWWVSRNPKSPE
ncbi:hypothetical protein CONPUDRAFT_148332 [Coniophora puteana RWD-64-598 SS2]|uniref:Uncharacterized protein n=1 Tax=Coniophora puteana (strain RWD-64-598) TaxID=741705 RepID=A0A5M3N487_CONPW|nr:uncharacterized protein CONPUDRAFT_148332 [Coniophora puteana RWD-64-598 SS2]EIW86239.1 hypothetical protein CONPUDRAFT_148332 [Coniophora puteana RWD-64-598 SS2]